MTDNEFYEENSADEWKSVGDIVLEMLSNGGFKKLESTSIQKGSHYFESLQNIKSYYQEHEQEILDLSVKDIRRWFKVYPLDWTAIFTPIEYRFWCFIRSAGVVMYPQYPVLQYYVDFGHPYLKIAVECDGKEFHLDKKKDADRDVKIEAAGWTIYRFTGSEIWENVETDFTDHYGDFSEARFIGYLKSTVEGFIDTLSFMYFRKIIHPDYEWMYQRAVEHYKMK